jgi:predicted MPP superfamily phosphohydrolase
MINVNKFQTKEPDMNPNKPITRRSFLKRGLFAMAGLLASAGLVSTYASYVEPRWYEIKRIKLTFPRLPESFRGTRIVHFSDVHLGHHFDLQNLRVVITTIMGENPDLICFTGDLFDSSISEDPDQTSELLSQLKAPLGQWSILGNHDYYVGSLKTKALLKKGGFTTLVNEHTFLNKGRDSIRLIGVDDMWNGKPNLALALKGAKSSAFSLLLSHAANFADTAAQHPIDLQLSGHSHGGQVRLPIVGAVTTPPYGDKYVMGHYQVKGSNLQVYTNRGVGTTSLPIRFLCRPEITVITLDNKLT